MTFMFSDWDFMFKKQAPPEPDFYFELEIEPKLRLAVIDLCHGRKVPSDAVKRLLEAVLDARRINAPLRKEHLDWTGIEAEARRQGISVADALFDKMGHHDK